MTQDVHSLVTPPGSREAMSDLLRDVPAANLQEAAARSPASLRHKSVNPEARGGLKTFILLLRILLEERLPYSENQLSVESAHRLTRHPHCLSLTPPRPPHLEAVCFASMILKAWLGTATQSDETPNSLSTY